MYSVLSKISCWQTTFYQVFVDLISYVPSPSHDTTESGVPPEWLIIPLNGGKTVYLVPLPINGASKGNLRLAAAGGVIRLNDGSFVAGFSFFIDHAATNTEAEAYRLYKGIELCMGFSSFCILSDSKVVMDIVRSVSSILCIFFVSYHPFLAQGSEMQY